MMDKEKGIKIYNELIRTIKEKIPPEAIIEGTVTYEDIINIIYEEAQKYKGEDLKLFYWALIWVGATSFSPPNDKGIEP